MSEDAADVFVIRMWLERTPGGGHESKRGYVEHLESGQRRYFCELVEAMDFLAALSDFPREPAAEVPPVDPRST
jgi:hypothetical protein